MASNPEGKDAPLKETIKSKVSEKANSVPPIKETIKKKVADIKETHPGKDAPITETIKSKVSDIKETVQDYYGKAKKTVQDMTPDSISSMSSDLSKRFKTIMGQIHEDILKRSYVGGFYFPEAIEQCKVLDLGSGAGRDVFVLSKLVGETGHVVGVEKTSEKLDVANKYVEYHTKMFGYAVPNVEFKIGDFDDLKGAQIPDNYFDSVVFNGVNNLAEDKKKVLAEAHRVLKSGGEIFFTNICSDREIPEKAKKDKDASDYLRGAMYWRDLHSICSEMGVPRPILVMSKLYPIKDEKNEKLAAGIHFVAATYRIFKIDQKAIEEDGKGSKVIYKGSIVDHDKSFKFAEGLIFPHGIAVHIDSTLTAMLENTRFGQHFDFEPITPKHTTSGISQVKEVDPFSCAQPASAEGMDPRKLGKYV
jgi:arsenite methyltransferase